MYAKWIEQDGRFAFAIENNGGAEITPEAHRALMEAQSAGKWIAADSGGSPVAIDQPGPTLERRISRLLAKVDAHLDDAAKAKGYDNIINASLRAAYAGPFHAEGVAFAQWMDATYAACYELLAQFKTGEIQEPTAEQLIALLPALVLPK